MVGEDTLNWIVSGRFKVGVAVCHSERLVPDHLLGVLQCAARHDDVRTEGVPVVVEVEVGESQPGTNPVPSGFEVSQSGSVQVADHMVCNRFDTLCGPGFVQVRPSL